MAEFTKEQLIERARHYARLASDALKHVMHPTIRESCEMDLRLAEITLAALTAEPEVWGIENPGEGTCLSYHPPRDFENAECVYYRLPLLEGLK